MTETDLHAVESLIRSVGDGLLMRHWRTLSASNIREKTKGDFVTDVDEEAERLLSAGLLAIVPQAAVLGEEAAAANPDVLNLLQQPGDLWIVDPVDGTGNYIDGKPHFAIMVAYVADGVTRASWIYQPVPQKLFHARAGEGAWCNGVRLHPATANLPLKQLHVGISVKFTPEPLRAHVEAQLHHFASHTPFMCAGYEYAALADGEKAMAMFHRLLPWDHVPGLLLAQEAGLYVRHLDGALYQPRIARQGLIVASNETLWTICRDLLVPENQQTTDGPERNRGV
jgi:fructose-1,6-bisphosphatase/inositol monophosphatase family enzyme